MADIINWSQFQEDPDLESMDRIQLLEQQKDVRARLERLDGLEPEDMESEEYELWGDLHEYLEDLADEIQDLLDEQE